MPPRILHKFAKCLSHGLVKESGERTVQLANSDQFNDVREIFVHPTRISATTGDLDFNELSQPQDRQILNGFDIQLAFRFWQREFRILARSIT